MNRVIALVEGDTEQAVIEQAIAPVLGIRGIDIRARRIGKPGHKGGTRRRFEFVLRELKALVRQEEGRFVTTFFDYYGLPSDWPGVADSKGRPAREIPGIVEPAIAKAVCAELGESFDPQRFIAYIQMYELEALLFSGPKEMAEAFERPQLQSVFEKVVEECGGCEDIDDDPDKAPSKRIQEQYSGYKKGRSELAHAPRIVHRIGLERIREACPHFNEWMSRLEQL